MTYIDFIIIACYLSLIFGVGIFTRNYVNGFSDFMVANRSVSLPLGVVTMLGTELGLITVMYNAQTGINGLFSSFHIGLAAFIVTLLIGLTGFVVVELRRLKVKSIPEYYNLRFGPRTRILGAVLLCLGGILNMGLFLKVGAIFIQSIFGIDSSSNLLTIIMLVLLILVLVYTISGGMLSVIVTDYIQYVVLSISFILCVFYSIKTLGWNNIFNSLNYIINLNTREIVVGQNRLKLTEREKDFLMFLKNSKEPQTIRNILESVWRYSKKMETHTVETHVHRLRKKFLDSFNDNNFIKNNKKGYYI